MKVAPVVRLALYFNKAIFDIDLYRLFQLKQHLLGPYHLMMILSEMNAMQVRINYKLHDQSCV